MNNSIYRDFAIRLYMNPRYGTKMGPTRTNPFLFNGSISFPLGATKQYVDLADFDNLDRSFSQSDCAVLRPVIDQIARSELAYAGTNNADFLAGQVFELEPEKTYRSGFIAINMNTWKGWFVLGDDQGLIIDEAVRFRFCQNTSARGKSPDYLGTNFDLKSGVSAQTPAAPVPSPVADILKDLVKRQQHPN